MVRLYGVILLLWRDSLLPSKLFITTPCIVYNTLHSVQLMYHVIVFNQSVSEQFGIREKVGGKL